MYLRGDDAYIDIGTHKRGDTFKRNFELVDLDGAPVSGLAAQLTCHGRYIADGPKITELAIIETDTPGTYQMYSNDTQKWSRDRRLWFDIEFSGEQETYSTKSFCLTVEGDYTHE